MIKRYFSYILAIVSVLTVVCTGCTTGNPALSDVAIFVTPGNETEVILSSGQKERYEIEMSTIHDYVATLTITSFDRQYGETVLLDKTVNQKKSQTTYVYSVPEIPSENSIVTLTFKVVDNKGNIGVTQRIITIVNDMVLLAEKTGITLYSPNSKKPDALELAEVTRPFSLINSPYPERADIYMVCDDSFGTITWKSNTATKFIRNNSFNYAEATSMGIAAVYNSSLRYDEITDIQSNDIIIVGHGNTAQGVFLVTHINRGDTASECYIILNYKEIKQRSDVDDEEDTSDNSIEEM